MSDYEVIPISADFQIDVIPSSHLSLTKSQEKRVDELWKQAPGTAFNGQCFTKVRLEKNRLVGQFVPYKYYFAQRLDPSLGAIQPVAISGITTCGSDILVGQRSDSVTAYPGYFELAPSGSIDPSSNKNGHIDYVMAAAKELEEETGIRTSSITPLWLVIDNRENTIELCLKITVNKKPASFPIGEYSHCQWMSSAELKKLIMNNSNRFVPLSRFLIELKVES